MMATSYKLLHTHMEALTPSMNEGHDGKDWHIILGLLSADYSFSCSFQGNLHLTETFELW